MNFANHIWLYLAPAILLAALAMILQGLRRREHLLARFAARRLLSQLTEKAALGRTLLKAALAALGLAAVALSLARPQYGIEWSERKARGLDIVFVLDSSKSMLATDLRPTRLARAKLAVLDLVERLESDRVGLVAYAGQAFLQTPPTLDYAAFRESLDAIGPGSLSRGGSDLGRALEEAAKAFPVESNVKAVVLLTDGEDLGGEAIQTAGKIARDGIKVFAIGIGTAEGAYLQIRNPDGEDTYLRDNQGQPVRSRLDESALQQIATLTGGQYQRLGGNSLEQFYASVIATLPRSERDSEMREIPIERFQWPLSAAFLFLTVEMLIRRRRPTRLAATSLYCLTLLQGLAPSPLSAGEALPETPLPMEETTEAGVPGELEPHMAYNDGREAILEGDYTRASARFDTAVTASNDFKLQRDALYNKGHGNFLSGEAAFRSGDFQQAIDQWKQSEAAFRSAVQIDPDDSLAQKDAGLVEARRKALEEYLEQQEQQQDEQQEQQDEQQEQEESNEDSSNSQNPEDQQGEGQEEEQPQNGGDGSESGEDASSEENTKNEEESSDQSSGESQEESGDPGQPEDSSNGENAGEEESEGDEPSGSEPEEPEEENGQEQGQPLPENPPEDSDDESTGQAAAGSAQPVEGMTQVEARALLDSMREGEQLLPFVEQNAEKSGQRKPLQDW